MWITQGNCKKRRSMKSRCNIERIFCQVAIENITNGHERLELSALVDTGASLLTLPKAWKEKLGDLQTIGDVELETAAQTTISGEICGPVKIQIEGFRPVFGKSCLSKWSLKMEFMNRSWGI